MSNVIPFPDPIADSPFIMYWDLDENFNPVPSNRRDNLNRLISSGEVTRTLFSHVVGHYWISTIFLYTSHVGGQFESQLFLLVDEEYESTGVMVRETSLPHALGVFLSRNNGSSLWIRLPNARGGGQTSLPISSRLSRSSPRPWVGSFLLA